MATLTENLRTKFLATSEISAKIGQRMHVDHVPQNEPRPFIYLSRQATEHAEALDDAQGSTPFHQSFAIECVADLPHDTNALADAVRTLHDFSGTAGDQTVRHLFVDSQSGDYVPVNAGGDFGRFIESLALEVYV